MHELEAIGHGCWGEGIRSLTYHIIRYLLEITFLQLLDIEGHQRLPLNLLITPHVGVEVGSS